MQKELPKPFRIEEPGKFKCQRHLFTSTYKKIATLYELCDKIIQNTKVGDLFAG